MKQDSFDAEHSIKLENNKFSKEDIALNFFGIDGSDVMR